MMRGLIVVFTALGSIIFLKRRLHRHHWLGVVILTVGIGIVGFASLWHEKKNPESEKQTTSVVGILFLLGSQIAVAAMMIVEEKLLSKYYLNPLKVVGWEGVWAMSIYSIMLIILQCIKCEGKLCPHGRLEDTVMALQEFQANPWILVLSFLIIGSIAVFNGTGVAVTKFASAAQRSTIDTSRTVLVWVVFLLPGPA